MNLFPESLTASPVPARPWLPAAAPDRLSRALARLVLLDVAVRREADDAWRAIVPLLPGCEARGGSRSEAVENARRLAAAHVVQHGGAPSLDDGDPDRLARRRFDGFTWTMIHLSL